MTSQSPSLLQALLQRVQQGQQGGVPGQSPTGMLPPGGGDPTGMPQQSMLSGDPGQGMGQAQSPQPMPGQMPSPAGGGGGLPPEYMKMAAQLAQQLQGVPPEVLEMAARLRMMLGQQDQGGQVPGQSPSPAPSNY